MEIVFIVLFGVLFLAVAVIYILHFTVNDLGIPSNRSKLNLGEKHTVLLVVAHPDDEVMAAGTLLKLKQKGSAIHLLYLTHGEDGPTGGLVERSGLKERRTHELGEVSRILSADSLTILDYPDRYLNTIDKADIKAAMKDQIISIKPDIVITFDNTIGLYGSADHVMAGMCTQELLTENRLGVKHLLIMTLCGRMIELALKLSKTFRERYNTANGLPKPDFYVGVTRFGSLKKAICHAHKTQWQVMNDVQPLYNKIPTPIYYTIFGKEYYKHIKLK